MEVTIKGYQLDDMLGMLLSNGYIVNVGSNDNDTITIKIVAKKIEIKGEK